MSKVGIGVIGAGNISEMHVDGYKQRDDVDLVMIADMVPERASEKAAKHGFAHHTGDVDELLARDDIQAVSICTWNNSHAELAIRALRAGRHVLGEKPLCMSVDEALELQKVVHETGKHFELGQVRRYGQNATVLKSFIDAGDLGDIHYAKASMLRRAGNPGGWFADPERSGGGPLIDIGVHCIDLAWWLMGKPKVTSVSANSYSTIGNRANITTLDRWLASDYDPAVNGVEDLVNAVIRFDNGASIMADVSYSLHIPKETMLVAVYGDKGGAELEPSLQLVSEKYDTILNIEPQIANPSFDFQSFHKEIGHFVDLVKGEAEPFVPVEDGVEMIRILRAIYESAEAGREVTIER
ncbi:Gfo/Idh/MocA family protein [Aestuariimicrobium ganziense]|uniref:Gfo/Idh/MocA family protein n=1 Tax=Aestuariimicrobium ganziense TaxID=2773677 RepID=UPI00194544CF|nr:Gfo/Idh/MocA family oxidoreductase [Aestuariimicrobium ganziense]